MAQQINLDWSKFKLIGIVASLAFILTYVGTSRAFITPLYKAETIIYVPLFIPARQMENQGIGFASDKEIDGHIQILISGRMKDTLAKIFNLYEHYNIEDGTAGAKSILYSKIEERVAIQKTRYNSVSIEVRDESPEVAAEMANKLATLGDIIKEELLSLNRRVTLSFAVKVEKKQEAFLKRLQNQRDSLIEKNLEDTVAIRKDINGIDKLLYREYENLLTKKDNVRKEQENVSSPLPSSYVLTEATPGFSAIWPPRLLLSIVAFVIAGVGIWFIQLLIISAKSNK